MASVEGDRKRLVLAVALSIAIANRHVNEQSEGPPTLTHDLETVYIGV